MPNSISRSCDAGQFLQKTLDSLSAHIAILDERGVIVAVNAAWDHFGKQNGASSEYNGPGANYLFACDNAKGPCSAGARQVGQGIRAVASGKSTEVTYEYPCHSPQERRWFCVRITRFELQGKTRVVVSHENITQRKLVHLKLQDANERLREKALTDGLTGLGNRRAFDAALLRTWNLHARQDHSISLGLIDVDWFKLYNDSEGHLAGDECLQSVSEVLQDAVHRPGDHAFRYGGEEFALIMPETDGTCAETVCERLVRAIRDLKIAHPDSPTDNWVTVSVGCCTARPQYGREPEELVKTADEALYEAKEGGRNRFILRCENPAGVAIAAAIR